MSIIPNTQTSHLGPGQVEYSMDGALTRLIGIQLLLQQAV